jgi:hypothetical protein
VESFTIKELASKRISKSGEYDRGNSQSGAVGDVYVPGDAARSSGVPGPQLHQQISDTCGTLEAYSLQLRRLARLGEHE